MRAVVTVQTLDFQGDLGNFIFTYGPAMVGILVLTVFLLYLLAYTSRYFEYLKAQESLYFDRSTLDLIKRFLMGVWVALLILADFYVALVTSHDPRLNDLVYYIAVHVPSLLLVSLVIFGGVLAGKAIHRFVVYMRGDLEKKPEKTPPPQTLSFLELFLKYFVYIAAFLAAFFGGLALLPASEDVGIRGWIVANVVSPTAQAFNPPTAGFVVATLVLTFLGSRLADSILQDYKRRTRKFTPRVINVFRNTARYVIYGLGGLVVFLILLFRFLDATQQLIVGVALLTLLILSLVVSYDSIKNGLAGIVLMNADELEEGERVKIGEELVCDVVRMDLTTTQVRDLRGEVVFIPNRELLNTTIMNFSRSKPFAVPVELQVAFDVPHWRVEEILLKAAQKTKGILDEPAPHVFAKDVNGQSITYQLWAYMDSPRELKTAKTELIWNLQELFHQVGIKALLH